jgi:hypothetical protein
MRSALVALCLLTLCMACVSTNAAVLNPERQLGEPDDALAAEESGGARANGIILGDTKEPNAGTKIIGSLLGTGPRLREPVDASKLDAFRMRGTPWLR